MSRHGVARVLEPNPPQKPLQPDVFVIRVFAHEYRPEAFLGFLQYGIHGTHPSWQIIAADRGSNMVSGLPVYFLEADKVEEIAASAAKVLHGLLMLPLRCSDAVDAGKDGFAARLNYERMMRTHCAVSQDDPLSKFVQAMNGAVVKDKPAARRKKRRA